MTVKTGQAQQMKYSNPKEIPDMTLLHNVQPVSYGFSNTRMWLRKELHLMWPLGLRKEDGSGGSPDMALCLHSLESEKHLP